MFAGLSRRQRHSRFEALELDPCARTRPQQPIGRLTQPCAVLRGILRQRGIERREEGRDIAVNPVAQRLIDKHAALSCPVRLGEFANWPTIYAMDVCGAILPIRLRDFRFQLTGGACGKAFFYTGGMRKAFSQPRFGTRAGVIGHRKVQGAPLPVILRDVDDSKIA